ncbi:MAG: hypothetical protein AMXMBFR58_25900 [Phycisphaerae bacterium]
MLHNRIALGVAAAVAATMPASVSRADTISIVCDRDNTLYEPNDLVQRSNGSGVVLFSGKNNDGKLRRALVRFDVSTIPAGATINSVTLRLTLDQTISLNQPASVHRVTADWGEGASNAGLPGGQGTTPAPGDATWIHRFFDGTLWSTPGGDYNATASSSATHSGTDGPKEWTSAALAQDVRDWLADPSTNFGWVIRGNEASMGSARRYHSREAAVEAQRPVLIVDYTPCKADFDGTGFVDTDDFDAFVHAFELGDDSADFDETGFVDTDDFDAFVRAFEQGC